MVQARDRSVQILYRDGGSDPREYQLDFVAETEDMLYMLEPKRQSEMNGSVVLAKQEAAVRWCAQVSRYMQEHAGKAWRYALISHDAIAKNVTLKGLAAQLMCSGKPRSCSGMRFAHVDAQAIAARASACENLVDHMDRMAC